MRHLFSLLLATASCFAWAQPKEPIFRYPDVSRTHIVFSFANDLWLVPKSGGQAVRLSSPPGSEIFPRFSPDGQTIAFSGNYDGSTDIYTIPVTGGVPRRITHHHMAEYVIDWMPDGKHLVFASSMHSGKQRFSQFYKIPATGGLPEQLPIAHAEMGAISPDGRKIAFTDKTLVFRTWKRYRGGTAPDIHIFNLDDNSCTNITQNDASDELPMWSGDKIYYLSDRGENKKSNLWSYDTRTKQHKQLTTFADYDVVFPAIGPEEIVFEAGGKLFLLSLANEKIREVSVQVVHDFEELKPRQVDVRNYLNNLDISPDGKRLVAEARGEIFSIPSEHGVSRNISGRSGSAERYPAWSPDGTTIAYWTDKKGEYDLAFYNLKTGQEEIVTGLKNGFRYGLTWSPDSRKLAYIDQSMRIQYYDRDSKQVVPVAQEFSYFHYGLENFRCSWSPDSRWLAIQQDSKTEVPTVGLYDTKEKKYRTIPSGFYAMSNPVFDPTGKYLYVLINDNFDPSYSNFDNSWVYNNSERIGVFVLQKDSLSPLSPRNDEVAMTEDTTEAAPSTKEKDKKKSDKKKDAAEEKQEDKKKAAPVQIDWDGLEARLVILPVAPGNFLRLAAAEDKLLFLRMPNTGTADGVNTLKYYDLKEREEKEVVSGLHDFLLSADRKKLMIYKYPSAYIVDVGPGQKLEKPVDMSGLRMNLDPRSEWQQLFNDSWRMQRDFFYDPGMHGVDWNKVKTHYQALLDKACSRSDVNYVIGEMIGELNASHAYRGGGDHNATTRRDNVGHLGINWSFENGAYRIAKIIRTAPWETEIRSPLAEPGVKAREGDYILAVNGMPLSSFPDPWAAFSGLGDRTVELTVNSKPDMAGAWKVIVTTLLDETRLRNLAWIESNRQYVDSISGGRIGYIYVPSTGLDGQYELARMFYGQFKKPALLVDERFNNGGQIPDRFVELLNRKPLAFWNVRDGADWQWPPVAHFGPKAILINGWSGSGGDAFPDFFRKAGLGPVIGSRTWGGLIGISGSPGLIDGGYLSVPTFRMYDPDGEWFPEGHGVDPDILVPEDYSALARGVDKQLERAVQELLKALDTNPKPYPQIPKVENRSN